MKNETKKASKPRIVVLGPETLSGDKAVDSNNLCCMKRATTITRSITIRATAERCFALITKQLEEKPDWDPTIMWVNPINIKQTRVGSMSKVTFVLNGIKEEAVAVIRSFQPNKSILWTSNNSTQLQEHWNLQTETHGTLVAVTIGYNPIGWILGRLTDRLFMKGKIEKSVTEMLQRLKKAAEVDNEENNIDIPWIPPVTGNLQTG